VPLVPTPLLDQLRTDDAEAPAVVCAGHTWTRADIADEATRLASALVELGVGPGDRVAVVRRNSVLHFTALLAANRIGAVLVPVNFRLPAREVARILEDSRPRVTLCGPRHADEIDDVQEWFTPTTWVVDDIDPVATAVSPDLPDRWLRLGRLMADATSAPPSRTVGSDDLVMLQYTSGSTGRPRGVRIAVGNLAASWRGFEAALGIGPEDVVLAGAPFGHVGGLNTLALQTLLMGGVNIVQRQFDAHEAITLIELYGVTTMFGVPSMYEALAAQPDFPRRDMTSLRAAVVGGAPINAALLDELRGGGVPVVPSWGMTETCGGVTFLLPEEVATHPGSVGRVAAGSEVCRVPGPTGPLTCGGDADHPGELLVRGPVVTQGYWGCETSPVDDEGWLHTGDLGWIDAEGYVQLAGRLKELIISGGENIWPAEIENELRGHPDVADVLVVGVPDETWGETPALLLVTSAGRAPLSLAEIRSHLDGRLARYKLPRHVVPVPAIPLGRTGKPDRHAARDLVLDALAHS